MEDETIRLAEKAQELGDLELAVLLGLIAGEHCIIRADAGDIGQAEQELQSICAGTFALKSAVLHCDKGTTPDDFGKHILIQHDEPTITPTVNAYAERDSFFNPNTSRSQKLYPEPESGEEGRIADVVIARNLHLATQQVQIQALELMRGKRIFTRKAMYTAPRPFLLIALITAGDVTRLVPHVNDYFFISHYYQSEETGFGEDLYQHENTSTGSVVRTPGLPRRASYLSYLKPLIQMTDIDTWTDLSSKVRLSSDVRAYMHNIVVFLRMHRAVASGASPHATRHLYALARALAPLHDLDFITPSLVALAVRKIYPHRLTVVKPEDEMSLQWGSSLEAIADYLEGITPEDIIEDVLERVETPL